MEVNLSPLRLILLFGLIGWFWWMGGFEIPVRHDGLGDAGQMAKAWQHCVLMFLAGAASATVIDHHVGTLDRTNLRVAYIVLGVLLMIGSCLWSRAILQTIH